MRRGHPGPAQLMPDMAMKGPRRSIRPATTFMGHCCNGVSTVLVHCKRKPGQLLNNSARKDRRVVSD